MTTNIKVMYWEREYHEELLQLYRFVTSMIGIDVPYDEFISVVSRLSKIQAPIHEYPQNYEK